MFKRLISFLHQFDKDNHFRLTLNSSIALGPDPPQFISCRKIRGGFLQDFTLHELVVLGLRQYLSVPMI